MKKCKYFWPIMCFLLFFSGAAIEGIIDTFQREDIVRLSVVTEFKACVTDTEVDLHRMRAFQNPRFGDTAASRVEFCEKFLDEYGPEEPDEGKSNILGEMKLFVYGYKKHVQEMVDREKKLIVLYDNPFMQDFETIVALEKEQIEGFMECFRFTDTLQRLAREAIR